MVPMTRWARSKTARVAAAAIVVGALGISAWALFGTSKTEAGTVEVRENGKLVGAFNSEDALEQASRIAGFPVRPVGDAPAGFSLVLVQAEPDNRQAGQDYSNSQVFLQWAQPAGLTREAINARSHAWIQVIQMPIRIGAPDDRANLIDPGAPGLEVWYEHTANGVEGYTVLGADRTYLVIVYPGIAQPPHAAMLKMIRTMQP
ncbi:MAG: hypothetical protein HY875_13665 [Chloroflexi bacterium]|nr:hypothetical protein [Chloroflexota bacterium]